MTISSLLLIVATIICAVIMDGRSKKQSFTYTNYGECSVVLNEIGEVTLVNEVIAKWFESPGDIGMVEKLYEQYREFGRLDYPNPVVVSFSVINVPSNKKIVKQNIVFSETSDFLETRSIDVPLHQNKVSIYNLKTGITYFYRVTINAYRVTTKKRLHIHCSLLKSLYSATGYSLQSSR